MSMQRLIKFDGPHQQSGGMAPPLAADGDGQKNSRKIKRLRDVSCMRKRETKQVRTLSTTQSQPPLRCVPTDIYCRKSLMIDTSGRLEYSYGFVIINVHEFYEELSTR